MTPAKCIWIFSILLFSNVTANASNMCLKTTDSEETCIVKLDSCELGLLEHQGPKNELGLKGDKGHLGKQGLKGEPGLKGDKGLVGEQGRQGEPGDKGDKGDKGNTGDTGLKGEQGIEGQQGLKGEPGLDGKEGPRGDQGPRGETGSIGDKGLVGEQGRQGEPGDKGDKGDKGDTGGTGLKGEQGIEGQQGLKGEPGLDGKEGPTGGQGPQGYPGLRGDQGPKGDTGSKGELGSRGEMGIPGMPGTCGCGYNDFTNINNRPANNSNKEYEESWGTDGYLGDICRKAPRNLTITDGLLLNLKIEVNCDMATNRTCIAIDPTREKSERPIIDTYRHDKNPFWLSHKNLTTYDIYNLNSEQILYLQSQSLSANLTIKYHCYNSDPKADGANLLLLSWNDIVIGPTSTPTSPFFYYIVPDDDGCSKPENQDKWSFSIIKLVTPVVHRLPVIDFFIQDIRDGVIQELKIEVVELCFG